MLFHGFLCCVIEMWGDWIHRSYQVFLPNRRGPKNRFQRSPKGLACESQAFRPYFVILYLQICLALTCFDAILALNHFFNAQVPWGIGKPPSALDQSSEKRWPQEACQMPLRRPNTNKLYVETKKGGEKGQRLLVMKICGV